MHRTTFGVLETKVLRRNAALLTTFCKSYFRSYTLYSTTVLQVLLVGLSSSSRFLQDHFEYKQCTALLSSNEHLGALSSFRLLDLLYRKPKACY